MYGNIYNGGSPGTFIADLISDAAAILDRMRTLNPNIQIVVVNLPHIGITPDVKSKWPTDPVKTARVTSVMLDINRQLAGLSSARGLCYADIFTPTLSLLGTASLCVHGMPFFNTGSTNGDLNYVWLNGQYSANFHPNTNAQTLVVNEIIHAFYARYSTGIAPLTATEILSGLLAKSAAAIDMPFATWKGCLGLTGLPGSNDSDGDGLPHVGGIRHETQSHAARFQADFMLGGAEWRPFRARSRLPDPPICFLTLHPQARLSDNSKHALHAFRLLANYRERWPGPRLAANLRSAGVSPTAKHGQSLSRQSVFRRLRIQGIAQTITEEIQGQQRHRKKQTRKQQQPGIGEHHVGAFLDQHTPGAVRRLQPETEEG